MEPALAETLPVVRAVELQDGLSPRRRASFDYASTVGRLVELPGGDGTAPLGVLFSLVREAQALGEPVVWVGWGDTVFFPPDVAAGGVDLDSLAVVRAAGIREALRATHHLLCSGAFGMVILDAREEQVPQGILGRCARLAEKNATAFLCLTEGGRDRRDRGLGSLVSMRVQTRLRRLSPGLFQCELQVTKDKRSGPGLRATEVYRAPPGLR